MVFKRSKTLKRSDHVVSRKDIDRDALFVMQHLNRNGFKAYLVGGSVRDLMLGRAPKDFDVSTDAEPQQIKRLFRNCFLIGRRFRLAHIRFGRDKIIETSTFRRQPDPPPKDGSLVQWDDNQFGTPVEDAFRRDFTVNALFYDLTNFEVIDHVGGLSDLKRKLIRTIGDPNIRFREDPVRMIRAVRFAGRLGFKFEARTKRAIIKHADEISQAAPARLLEELYKLFAFESAESSFRHLWELKLMKPLLPEIDAYISESGGKKSRLWSALAALDSDQFGGDPTHTAYLLAGLFQLPALAFCKKQSESHPIQACAEWLASLGQRFRMPKGVSYRVLRLLENQIRMVHLATDKQGSRQRKAVHRILEHGSFPESMALLRIRCATGSESEDVLHFWESIEMDHPTAHSSAVEDGSKPLVAAEMVKRPRRRRRKKRPTHEA